MPLHKLHCYKWMIEFGILASFLLSKIVAWIGDNLIGLKRDSPQSGPEGTVEVSSGHVPWSPNPNLCHDQPVSSHVVSKVSRRCWLGSH